MDYVKRSLYLGRIEPFASNGNAKVITGIRRSGKSTLLKELGPVDSKNVLRIDMELWNNRRYRDPDEAYRYIQGSIENGTEVVIIDEIQDIGQWPEIVRSLIAEQTCDLYITGSNSKLLSGEFSDLLTGRYNRFDTFTLTYSECCEFARKYLDLGEKEVFTRFLRTGGFPSTWKNRYAEQESLSEVGDILDAILMKDLVLRYNIRKPDILHRMLRYICDNIGNKTSVYRMYSALSTEDGKLSKDLVYEYMDHLESACLIHRAETFDIKGKKILTSGIKYYIADIGIKNVVCGFRPDDMQGYVENILYLEMRARGYDVWLGDDSGNEVDFVCKRGDETIYIQATTRLTDEKVVEREFGNMSGIRDNHPKYVVTFEKTPLDSDMDGIKCVLLEDFLKNGRR